MKKVKITVVKVACYKDLMEKYENPIEHACDMKEGMVFIANGYQNQMAFAIVLGKAYLNLYSFYLVGLKIFTMVG